MMISTFVAVAAFFFLLWIASIVLRDASIVDRFWGLAFVLIATTASAATGGFTDRSRLVTVLITVWGLRLSTHITARNLGRGEDYRYKAMRRRWGKRFPALSLVTVFAFQAAIAWVVSLPLQAAIRAQAPEDLGLLDFLGLAVWSVGFLFEAVADWQLMAFLSEPRTRGRVMNRGLWRYTRHPNYFGDALQWWGIWLFATAIGAAWTAIGPALMTFLLLRVSGVAMLERKLIKSRPNYEKYVRRTSAFLPLPPRRH